MSQVHIETCPGCGARVQINQKECEWCHGPIIVTTMSDIFNMTAANVSKYSKSYESNLTEDPDSAELNNSLGFCYLKMGFYDKALEKFDKAIERDLNNPETYLYAAACILAGNKPFVTPRKDIDRIETYINAALMIEERGIFRYFQAYIKHDFFKRKFLNTSPKWDECLAQANADGLSPADVEQLFTILKQEIPSVLKLS